MGVLHQLLFGKYLLVTNTLSCGLMMTAGDMIQQCIEHSRKRYLSRNTACIIATSPERYYEMKDNSDLFLYKHDYTRTKNMTVVGLLQGPFHHWFYMTLDHILPGKNAKSVAKKMFLDQSVASPICLATFFVGLGILEHRRIEEICKELKLKFRDTWKIDCCFWPPTQCINFLFVPLYYRVLYTNIMTMLYNIFLSYIKYDAHYE